MTSNWPSNCGYSFSKVLKQCGQLVMIFCTPFAFNISISDFACSW